MGKALAGVFRWQPLNLESYVNQRWPSSKEDIPLMPAWLKDIQVYVLECHLSLWEAIQLVKDYTSEQAQSEVEYYLGLTPKGEQSFSETD